MNGQNEDVPAAEAAGLDAGVIAIGPDVVAVVTLRLSDYEDGRALSGATSYRAGLPTELLAAALHDLAEDLAEDAELEDAEGGA